MTKFDTILHEALKLYLIDWKKTKHNSFQPDFYVFKSVMGIGETMPYILRASDNLKLKFRKDKLEKIRNKCRGLNIL